MEEQHHHHLDNNIAMAAILVLAAAYVMYQGRQRQARMPPQPQPRRVKENMDPRMADEEINAWRIPQPVARTTRHLARCERIQSRCKNMIFSVLLLGIVSIHNTRWRERIQQDGDFFLESDSEPTFVIMSGFAGLIYLTRYRSLRKIVIEKILQNSLLLHIGYNTWW